MNLYAFYLKYYPHIQDLKQLFKLSSM